MEAGSLTIWGTASTKHHTQVSNTGSEGPRMVGQPETRPISYEQLSTEVKGIYTGLVLVEAKCHMVVTKQVAAGNSLSLEQWHALVALHRTLLYEHHDFLLASQHPHAPPCLRKLAGKYRMPVRMWHHGIHSLLQLLKARLPVSLEHMLTFINIAYSMMALLYETVPAFEDMWVRCLGDLACYRMTVEVDILDREIWADVSRSWYSKVEGKDGMLALFDPNFVPDNEPIEFQRLQIPGDDGVLRQALGQKHKMAFVAVSKEPGQRRISQ